MKSKAKRFMSLIVTLVMAFTLLSMSMVSMTAGAADAKTYSRIKKYSVDYGGQTYKGYILIPENCEGQKYEVVLVYCGLGGLVRWDQYGFQNWMNKWVGNGYIKPCIFISPSVIDNGKDMASGIGSTPNEYNMFERNVRKQLGSMKEALLASEYGQYIDARKNISVGGYSMGGCSSLLAGTLYPNLYPNIASLSPSFPYYTDDGAGWIKLKKDVVFSKSSRAKRLLSIGKSEQEPFPSSYQRYEVTARNNGYRFKTYVSKKDGHNVNLFYREIFVFMYYLDHNTVLTDAQLEIMDYKT